MSSLERDVIVDKIIKEKYKVFWEDDDVRFSSPNSTGVSLIGALVLYPLIGQVIVAFLSTGIYGTPTVERWVLLVFLVFGITRGLTRRKRSIAAFLRKNSPISYYIENDEIYLGKSESTLVEKIRSLGVQKFRDELKIIDDEKIIQEKLKKDEKQKRIAEEKAIEKERKSRGVSTEKVTFEICNSFGFDPPLELAPLKHIDVLWDSVEKTNEVINADGFKILLGSRTFVLADLKKINYDHEGVVDENASSQLVGFETSGDEVINTILKSQGMGDWGLSKSSSRAIIETTDEKGRDIYSVSFEFHDGSIIACKKTFKYGGDGDEDENRQLMSIFFFVWNEIKIRDYRDTVSGAINLMNDLSTKRNFIEDEIKTIRDSITASSGKHSITSFRKLGVLDEMMKRLYS